MWEICNEWYVEMKVATLLMRFPVNPLFMATIAPKLLPPSLNVDAHQHIYFSLKHYSAGHRLLSYRVEWVSVGFQEYAADVDVDAYGVWTETVCAGGRSVASLRGRVKEFSLISLVSSSVSNNIEMHTV